MNFYTKVLTPFAATQDLKLEASFEAAVERDQAQSQADETRTGIEEVGLDATATLVLGSRLLETCRGVSVGARASLQESFNSG
jgi:hypothetical protein